MSYVCSAVLRAVSLSLTLGIALGLSGCCPGEGHEYECTCTVPEGMGCQNPGETFPYSTSCSASVIEPTAINTSACARACKRPPDMSLPVDMSMMPPDMSLASDMGSPVDMSVRTDMAAPALICSCVCGPKRACVYTRNGCR